MAFLAVPYFVNSLSKADFGKLSLYWISVPLISILIDLATRAYVKKSYIDNPSQTLKTINANIYLYLFMYLLLVSAYALIHTRFGLNFLSYKLDILILSGAFLFVITENYLAMLQVSGKVINYSIIYSFRNVLPYLITALIFCCFYESKIEFFAYVQILIYFIFGIYVVEKSFIIENYKEILIRIKNSLKFSLPILPSFFSALGLIYIDRILIHYYYSDSEVAEYTIAYTIASILSLLFTATGKWWQTFVFKELKGNNLSKIYNILFYYSAVILMFGVVIILLRVQLVVLLSNTDYIHVTSMIPTLVIGMFFLFLYSSLINVPFYYGKTRYFIIPAVSAFVVNLFLNLFLLPIFGYKIAALTTTISYFLEFLIIYFINKEVFNFSVMNYFTSRN